MKTEAKTFCKKCDLHKKIEEMVYSSKYGQGYKSLCKKCDCLYSKNRRKTHKNEISKQRRFFYKENRVRLLEEKVIYSQNNKEIISIRNRRYCELNKEKIRKKSYIRNKIRIKNDPIFRFKKNISHRIRCVLRKNGMIKSISTWDILGTDRYGLIRHFHESQGIDISNKSKIKDLELDHICPLSQAVNYEEVIKLNNFSNLQLISKKENIVKSNNKTEKGEYLCTVLLGRKWINIC